MRTAMMAMTTSNSISVKPRRVAEAWRDIRTPCERRMRRHFARRMMQYLRRWYAEGSSQTSKKAPESRRQSGGLVEDGLQSLANADQLRYRVLLVDLVQPDAGDVPARQQPRADEEVVEVLVDDAAQQV